VTYHTALNRKHLRRRHALLAAVLSAGLAASIPARADVPPAANAMSAANKATANKLVADAQKALQSGNGRLAFINLKNAVTADPGNFTARVMLGTILYRMGDSGGAERELRQARKDGAPPSQVLPPLFDVMLARNEGQLLLTQFPDPAANTPAAADILLARALALQSLNKAPEAKDAIDRSLTLRRDGRGLLIRARIALFQGQEAEARKFADEAITKSNTPDALLFKIGMQLSANENQAALELSNQLLEKYPGNLQGRFARIEAYMALKQDARAKPEVDDIVAKYPSSYMGTYYHALLVARAGDAKGAWNIAQNLPGEFRDSQPRIALMVAEMAADSGNEETAASILGRLLLKNKTLPVARVRLASIRLKQNNPDDALTVLGPVKDSPDVRVQVLLSDIYVRLNRNGEALDVLRKLDANGKAPPDVKRSIALLEVQAGQISQGIKDLSQLVAKEPTNPNLAAPLIAALTQAKRYPEALAVADRLGADPKQRSAAQMYRGGVLLTQKNNAGAQVAFDKAVAADPKNVAALYARAEFLTTVQKFSDASRDLRAILSLDAKNLAAFLKLAEIAAQQGQDQNVRTVLAQAIAAAPQSAAPRLVLLRYLTGRKDFKRALPVANDFLRVQPTNRDALTMLGQIQIALGQKKEAVTTYRRLVSQMPTAATPQVLLGGALSVAGDQAGAARALEAAVKLAPANAEVRAAQVRLLVSQKKLDAAVAAARTFQAANPGTAADLLLADTLERNKQRDQAISVLNKSFAAKPSNAVLLRLVGYAVQAKDAGRAVDMMSKWLATNPDDFTVRMEYANLLMQQEDSARASAQYEAVLKKYPDNVVALNNLGWLIQDRDPKRAISLLSVAMKAMPNSADVADTLGWLKLQQKDAAGGLNLLDKAHKLKPQDGEITYHLILALDANAKRGAARELLKGLLASNVQFKDRPAATQLASSWR
jgi:putative PEP-CTERM system TPR-repeat lipoprotein